MARHPALASLSRQRRRAPPAALDLTRSAFSIKVSHETCTSAQIIDISSPEVFECLNKFEEEQARASAELEHTQAAFTAALEDDPLPGVRARSPTAYRSAGRAIPMEVDDLDRPGSPPRPFMAENEKAVGLLPEGGYKFPLPVVTTTTTATYQLPPTYVRRAQASVETIDLRKKKSSCTPIQWSTVLHILRLKCKKRKGYGQALPEPLGFHERIKNSGHEWRPGCSQYLGNDKGGHVTLNAMPTVHMI